MNKKLINISFWLTLMISPIIHAQEETKELVYQIVWNLISKVTNDEIKSKWYLYCKDLLIDKKTHKLYFSTYNQLIKTSIENTRVLSNIQLNNANKLPNCVFE